MPEQAIFTLGEAAKTTGKSKATISNAIKTGRLSVQEKTESGYRIAASELFRAFPPNGLNRHTNGSVEQTLTPEPNGPNSLLQREIELLREERDRERRQFEGTIDDLRRRLDTEADERRRLTMLLTDQRQQQPPAPRPSPTGEGWRRRLAGWIAGADA
jgi:hypothetical protein